MCHLSFVLLGLYFFCVRFGPIFSVCSVLLEVTRPLLSPALRRYDTLLSRSVLELAHVFDNHAII